MEVILGVFGFMDSIVNYLHAYGGYSGRAADSKSVGHIFPVLEILNRNSVKRVPIFYTIIKSYLIILRKEVNSLLLRLFQFDLICQTVLIY